MSKHRPHISIIVPEGVGWPHAWCSELKDLGCLAGHAKNAGFRTDALAERLGTSTRALRREFRRALGLSLKDWLSQVRIIEVRTRLRGNERIGKIASSVGFAHSKELSREFRKAYGVTPSEFRTKERNRSGQLSDLTPS
jgi:AraC-like DNA-binding protein